MLTVGSIRHSNSKRKGLLSQTVACLTQYRKISRSNYANRDFSALKSHITPTRNAFFKTKLGPDAFQLTFNGPERASPSLWQHLGNCSYKLSYRLVNPGIYSVQLIHTYDEFKAVNEVIQNVWAKPVYRKLLVTEFVLDVCSSHCPSFTSKHLQSLDLPICSRNERQQGVYLRMTNETEREVYKWQMYGHPYIWEPLGCRFDQKFELNSNSTCFTKTHKSILVIGDSQARILSWALDRRLSGSKDPLNEPAKSYGGLHNRYYNPQETAHRGLPNKIILNRNDTVVSKEELERVTFKFQEYLNIFVDVSGYRTYDKKLNTSTTEKYLLDFDTVVFTVGHWPASAVHQGGHFSVERYVDLLEYISGYMESINRGRQSLGKQPLDFIWMDIYAFTIKLDPAVPHAKSIDWRINYRLKVWSDYANQIFQRRGMKQLNGFDATLPWAQSTLDGAHFHGTPAMDSQVDELLHKVNVCAR
ncbi:hypothetical protein BDR26DRAFT_938116 [Obelidium mucronatum]|nr:hypothetical protein BDR26DRAFT_938116 [Obelidium mucronatum]